MAKKADVGMDIGIEGEREFRQQIENINRDMKTLSSETKLVTSEFIGNEQSTEALTAQNRVLSAEIEAQTQKQKALAEMLEKVKNAYGADSKQAQQLQQQYNQTTAQINTMTARVEANNQQIGNNGTLLGKLGINLNTVAQKFGLSSSAANKLTSALGSQAAVYATVGAAVVKLVAQLNDLAIKQAEVVDSVNTMATKYHTTSQAIEAFNYAAKYTDVTTETMLGSLSKLTRNMDSAREGTGAAAEAFEKLGVSVTNQDGSLRSSQAVFLEVIDALRNISNETERDAAAMEIFGKSAMELNGVIEKGSYGLRSYMEEAARSGVIISDEGNAALQRLQDVKDKTDAIAEATKTNIAAAFAPVAEYLQAIRQAFLLLANDLVTGGTQTKAFFVELLGLKNANDDVAQSMDAATDSVKEYKDVIHATIDEIAKMTDAQRGWADLTAEQLRQSTGAALARQQREAMANAAAQGWDINWQAPGSMVEYNRMVQQAIQLDVTLDIDGQKLAHVTLDDFEAESQRRGRGATNNSNTTFSNR